MSEYQYYEFHALDRRLSQEEMAELRALSTRAQITPTSFTNFYDWGNFKGDPKRLMERYFDAFLYLANWGTRQLMLRLPSRLLDLETASRYCSGESASVRHSGEHVILEFTSDRESAWASGRKWEPEEDDTGEGWLASIIPVRAGLARGDHRCLYLGWLLCAMNGELDDDAAEPPVPPGLGRLSAPLDALARFLRIDADLIAVAAERSTEKGSTAPTEQEMAAWIASLPGQEKDALLLRVLQGDSYLGEELLQRVSRELAAAGRVRAGGGRTRPRTVSELITMAEERREVRLREQAERERKERERREREEAARRAKYLTHVADREEEMWRQVQGLIATRQPGRYDEAVELLRDLRDACTQAGRAAAFSARLQLLRDQHSRKGTLLRRLEHAGF